MKLTAIILTLACFCFMLFKLTPISNPSIPNIAGKGDVAVTAENTLTGEGIYPTTRLEGGGVGATQESPEVGYAVIGLHFSDKMCKVKPMYLTDGSLHTPIYTDYLGNEAYCFNQNKNVDEDF